MCKSRLTAISFWIIVHALDKMSGTKETVNFQHFEQGNITTGCGHIVSVAKAEWRTSCSLRCLSHKLCKGMLFNEQAIMDSQRCKLVTSQVGTRINEQIYTHYSLKVPSKASCNNLGLTINNPHNWRAGCPRLYFPLDQISEGTALGSDAGAIQFIPGKINNSFHLPNPSGNLQAYFHLGNYPSSDYCFPDPSTCKEGISVAFWLNILQAPLAEQAIITTIASGGPGFVINWSFSHNQIHIQFRRDSDTMIEGVNFDRQDFEESFGYGIWVHYIITYKAGAGIFGNNVQVYFNGEVHPKLQKWVAPWWQANTQDYDGRLEIGTYFLGGGGSKSSIAMDDLIIWEEQISCDDALRLYQTYQ